ncbi:MAG: hypothetical protein HYX68_26080 [Planctomycetes bacterium]|nr:hypothetical protein [Planctomycetota bacterium]
MYTISSGSHRVSPWLSVTGILTLFFFIGLLGLSGCTSGPANAVTGKVTLGDEIVAGEVIFTSSDGKEHKSPIGPDGKYTVNPPPGSYKVTIKGFPNMGAKVENKDKDISKAQDMSKMPTSTMKMGASPPTKYASADTSGLTYEMKAGKHTFDIPLTK